MPIIRVWNYKKLSKFHKIIINTKLESFNFLQKIKNGMKQLDICEKWVYYGGIRNGFPEYSRTNVRESHYHARMFRKHEFIWANEKYKIK